MFVFLNFVKSSKNTKSDADIKPYVPVQAVHLILCISSNGTLFVQLSGSQPCALLQLPVSLFNWAVRPGILFGHDFLPVDMLCVAVPTRMSRCTKFMFQWSVPEWHFDVPCFQPLSSPCLVTIGVFSPLVWSSWGWGSRVAMIENTVGAFM
jgi:hypothetical protein